MNIRRALAALAALTALIGGRPAAAEALTYDFWLNAPNGYPVTHLVLYARGGAQDNVSLSPVTLQPSGAFQLTHTVGFQATGALVLGITERDKDDRWDIVMFTSGAYAAAGLGQAYSQMFSNANPGYLGHNALAVEMQEAHTGDAPSLDAVTDFLRGPDAAAAYFDPHGAFSIIQFSTIAPPIGGSIPEPATLALLGIGLVGIASRRRSRQRTA